MSWNPEIYNRFKTQRAAPFYDLLSLVNVKPDLHVIDLGCGTGETTAQLAGALPESHVLGIDSSPEMLGKSWGAEGATLRFECISIEKQLEKALQWDVVFSNAALQWIPDHEALFPRIIAQIRPGGQLLVQMPAQHHNMTNRLLNELAEKAPYSEVYAGWNRVSPVLNIDRYAEILFESGVQSMQVFEKIYPLILKDTDELLTWVSGTALIPYLERLPESLGTSFLNAYKALLDKHFLKTPLFYPFKRILIEATF